MDSPLQLRSYQVDRIEVVANDDYENADSIKANIGVKPQHLVASDDPNAHQIRLDIAICSVPEERKLPYEVHVSGRAFFGFGENELSREDRVQLAVFNGSSILLGMLRTHVAEITALGPHGVFLIPPLNLADAFQDWYASLQQAAPAEIATEDQP